jgi:hypothetical protein
MQNINEESTIRAQVEFNSLKQQDVSVLHNTLQQLESDAESITILHHLIENRIKTGRDLLYRATAALAPINRFPAEVLARIFALGKHLELNFSPRMTWVAQRWRKVALSTPGLWNTIPLTGVARVSTYLERSGLMSLDIQADLRTYRVNIFEISRCMQVLESHRLRWRSVQILLEDHDQSQPILRQLEGICTDIQQQTRSGSLESIYFGIARPNDIVSSCHSSILNIPPIPSLRVVEQLAVDLFYSPSHDPTSFKRLSRLSLGGVHNMHLESHFFNALYAMPNLSELILDQCDFIMSILVNNPAPIDLKKLASIQLSLMPDEVVNLILARLHAPSLRRFELLSHELDGPSQILNWEIIRGKYTGLSVLRLSGVTSYATRFLLQWLAELSQLTVLSVIFRERLSPRNAERSSEQVLRKLADIKNHCCTKLHTLEVGVLAPSGVVALRAMLGSRPQLRSGKVSIVLGPEAGERTGQDKDIAWMQTHLNKLKIRLNADESDDEATSGEESGNE